MDIPKTFQSQIKSRVNEEYNKNKSNFSVKHSENEIKKEKEDLVDKVMLTTVDSSSFDKYVQQMENGKETVASKFINALEEFADKFADGIKNATTEDGE